MKEEALKYLRDFIDNNPEIGDYNTRVVKEAVDALEYRVPKKPFIIYYVGEDGCQYPAAYTCDNCRDAVDVAYDFCPNCGQAINWEKE